MAGCPYGIGFTVNGTIAPLWCGKWSCERCRVINAKLWAWRARLHVDSSDSQAYFWTLTLRSTVRTPYQGYRELKRLWDNLRKTMQRRLSKDKKKWSYLAFVECHPARSKVPHFHVISMSNAPVLGSHVSQPLKDLAFMCGFGYIAKEEEIEGGKAAGYVAKYASKHDPSMPRNFHRCRASKDWAKIPELEQPSYLVRGKDESLTEFLLRVNTRSDVDIEVLYTRYEDALDEYMIEQKRTRFV